MKTVTGTLVSSKPISLSKAAKILSDFASSDNGASPSMAAYLKRASASFNELVQLHKELKLKRGRPGDIGVGVAISNHMEHCGLNSFMIEGGENTIGDLHSEIKKREKVKIDIEDGMGSEGFLGIREDHRKRHKKKRSDDDEGELKGSFGVKNKEESTRGVVEGEGMKSHVGREGSFGKRHGNKIESNGIVGVAYGEQIYGDHSDTRANIAEDDSDSKWKNKEKKKKKRSNGGKEGKGGVAKDIVMNERRYSSRGGYEREGTENGMKHESHEGKKHKKTRKGSEVERRDDGGSQGAELRDQSYGGDGTNFMEVDGDDKKKQKKKRNQVREERENGIKVEVVESEKSESRKRKDKEVVHADRGFDDSEEQHRSKKRKKTKTDGYN